MQTLISWTTTIVRQISYFLFVTHSYQSSDILGTERQLSAIGIITTVAGDAQPGFSGDGGPAVSARLNSPVGIVLDTSGDIYIADFGNRVIRKITKSSGNISTVAGIPGDAGHSGDGGPATSAKLNSPSGIALDLSGNVYIADTGNHIIRMISKLTGYISTVAGIPTDNDNSGDGGPATSAKLNFPSGIALDLSGNIYIADSGNHMIRMISKLTGYISAVAGIPTDNGYSGDGGPATSAKLNFPSGVAVDIQGNIYIADTYNQIIRKVTKRSGYISTVAGLPMAPGYTGDDGPATSALMSYPSRITVDVSGNIYISESSIQIIRMVTNSTGWISTVAGIADVGGRRRKSLAIDEVNNGDGGPATSAQLGYTQGVAVDNLGNIYFASSNSIRKVSVPPTANPSARPTIAPSHQPSIVPTAIPTSIPTSTPTAVPTSMPTSTPTAIPTSIPTSTPTAIPTSIPTSTPTAVPTSIPTTNPTAVPTSIPTSTPTAVPTSIPTSTPTAVPTSIPTSTPTAMLTNVATMTPTIVLTYSQNATNSTFRTTVKSSGHDSFLKYSNIGLTVTLACIICIWFYESNDF